MDRDKKAACREKLEPVASVHSVRYRLGLARPITLEREAYSVSVSARPIFAVFPNPGLPPLSESEREIVGAVVAGMLAAQCDAEAILQALDGWFAQRSALTAHPDTQAVVLVGRPTDPAYPAPRPVLVHQTPIPFPAPAPDLSPGEQPIQHGHGGGPSIIPPDCSTCRSWKRRECDNSDAESYGDKTDPSFSCSLHIRRASPPHSL